MIHPLYLTHSPDPRNPQTVVNIWIDKPIQEVFDYLAPIYVPHIFVGSFLIPAIVNTSINRGWNKAGLSRTIYFDDGTTSQETMLSYESPEYFSYFNVQFTSKILQLLVTRLEGEWQFTSVGTQQTEVSWTYRAIPRNAFTRILVRYILIKLLRITLKKALKIGKQDLESGNLEGQHYPEESR